MQRVILRAIRLALEAGNSLLSDPREPLCRQLSGRQGPKCGRHPLIRGKELECDVVWVPKIEMGAELHLSHGSVSNDHGVEALFPRGQVFSAHRKADVIESGIQLRERPAPTFVVSVQAEDEPGLLVKVEASVTKVHEHHEAEHFGVEAVASIQIGNRKAGVIDGPEVPHLLLAPAFGDLHPSQLDLKLGLGPFVLLFLVSPARFIEPLACLSGIEIGHVVGVVG